MYRFLLPFHSLFHACYQWYVVRTYVCLCFDIRIPSRILTCRPEGAPARPPAQGSGGAAGRAQRRRGETVQATAREFL